jgi:hypothetical protein
LKFFLFLFSTGERDLEAMLNPFQKDNVVATSESELENELVSIPGQVPSELGAQIPTVVMENSSVAITDLQRPEFANPVGMYT